MHAAFPVHLILIFVAYIRYKLCKILIESKSWRDKTSICELRTVHLEILTEVVFTGATIFSKCYLHFAVPLKEHHALSKYA